VSISLLTGRSLRGRRGPLRAFDMLDAGLVGCLRVTGRFSQNAMTKSVYDQEINSFHCPVAGARRFPIEGNSPATHSTPVLPDSARGSAGESECLCGNGLLLNDK
jgi:hypothetical protein